MIGHVCMHACIHVVRPSTQACHEEDMELLADKDDDLNKLKKQCLKVRHDLNQKLPKHELALDDLLEVRDSEIPNAGSGLFFKPNEKSQQVINTGATICFYTGHRHNFVSQKYISDKSYLMNVGGDVLVDPGPLLSIKARYINDPLNEDFINCEFVSEPDAIRCAVVATRDILSDEELYISYGEFYWSQQTYAGTTLTLLD